MYLTIEGIFKRIKNPSSKDLESAFGKLVQSNCSYIMLETKDGRFFRVSVAGEMKYSIECGRNFIGSIFTANHNFNFNEARDLFLKFNSESSIDNINVEWIKYENILKPTIVYPLLILWFLLIITFTDFYFNLQTEFIIADLLVTTLWIIYAKKYFKSIWYFLGKVWFDNYLGKFLMFSSACVLFSWFGLFIKVFKKLLELSNHIK